MNRNPLFANQRLIVFSLLFVLTLASCKALGQSINLPILAGVPTPGSIDQGIEISSKYLICPSIPNTTIIIPPAPYDEDVGDCALRGKSAEIEAWLTALEGIAASCQANRDTNWLNTLTSRDYLDTKVNEFEEVALIPTPTVEVGEEDRDTLASNAAGVGSQFELEICPTYDTHELPDSSSDSFPSTHKYTIQLKNIGEDVEKYCKMIDNLIKPLWQACDEINLFQDCQAPDPEQYHSIITRRINTAQENFNSTELFYTNTLQIDGWGDFREDFNEASLDCPLIQAFPSLPIFTFSMNTFGRFGPSSAYEKVFTFLELQSVEIVGRSRDEPRWWLVLIPDSDKECWVSDSTGTAAGILEDLEIVQAPPLIIKLEEDECSRDLGENACKAAGGTWKDIGVISANYICKCP